MIRLIAGSFFPGSGGINFAAKKNAIFSDSDSQDNWLSRGSLHAVLNVLKGPNNAESQGRPGHIS